MAIPQSKILLFIAVPLLLLMLPLSIYFVDSAAASDKVARNVTIATVDVARQTGTEAIATMDAYTNDLTSNVIRVEVNGQTFELDPVDLGLTFDSESAVAEALGLHRDGIGGWLNAFSQEVDVPLVATLDPDMVASKLLEWERDAIPNPAFEGAISISRGVVTYEYPTSGEAIDRDRAAGLLLAALESGTDQPVVLPIVVATPRLTEGDIDTGVSRANLIIARGVTLTNEEYDFEFRVEPVDLGRALTATVTEGETPVVGFSVDHGVIAPLVEAARDGFEIDPVDASWAIVLVDDFEGYPDQYEITDSPQEDMEGLPENDTIEIVPGLNGTTIDVAEIAAAVAVAAVGDGTGELMVERNAAPEFTTAMAEAFGDLYELAEFTTRTPGRNRVFNIQLMADTVDNTIVMPGEEFSVNAVVGQRTAEKGYKHDCAIVGGELSCEQDTVNVGGGVSQFGTTIFNTIFFSCLEDVEHRPHSIYFTKYPEGREATLGFPNPDVKFLNNTQAPVIVRTSYTPRSITVTFFGNNGGVTCAAERGERTNFTNPAVTYRADEDGKVLPGVEHIANKGSGGWRITNTRIFYDVNGDEIDRENFAWTYRGERQVIVMHPCETKVGGDGICPVTVPSVAGLTQGEASAALATGGFGVAVVAVPTGDASLDGFVESYSPSGLQDLETVVTLNVWKWVES